MKTLKIVLVLILTVALVISIGGNIILYKANRELKEQNKNLAEGYKSITVPINDQDKIYVNQVLSKDGCLKLSSEDLPDKIDINQKISVKVILTNLSDKEYTFIYGGSSDGNPIWANIVTQEQYDMLCNPGLSVEFTLEANEQIEKVVEFSSAESGEYIFYAEVQFEKADGESENLSLETKNITVQ